MTECVVCRGPVRQPTRGRPRVTCSDRCRQKAHRLRRVEWPPDFETAEEALFKLIANGQEACRGAAADRDGVAGGGVSERLVDATAVADRLGVPKSWVLESARSGSIPHVRLGRYVRFDVVDVDAWLEKCKQPGRPIAFREQHPGRRT